MLTQINLAEFRRALQCHGIQAPTSDADLMVDAYLLLNQLSLSINAGQALTARDRLAQVARAQAWAEGYASRRADERTPGMPASENPYVPQAPAEEREEPIPSPESVEVSRMPSAFAALMQESGA